MTKPGSEVARILDIVVLIIFIVDSEIAPIIEYIFMMANVTATLKLR